MRGKFGEGENIYCLRRRTKSEKEKEDIMNFAEKEKEENIRRRKIYIFIAKKVKKETREY